MHPLMAAFRGVLGTDMPLHPHLRPFVVVAFADFLADALHRPADSLMLAVFLGIGQIVQDVLARQMRRDRLTPAGMGLARMRGDGSGARCVGRIRRLDRSQYLGLVEQHLLLGGELRATLL